MHQEYKAHDEDTRDLEEKNICHEVRYKKDQDKKISRCQVKMKGGLTRPAKKKQKNLKLDC